MTNRLNRNNMNTLYLILIAALLLIQSCGQTTKIEGSKHRVVTSIGMLADAVKVITSDSVDVTGLMGMAAIAANSPHDPVLDQPQFVEVRSRLGFRE